MTGVQALQLSVLRQKDVNDLEKAVMQQARDPAKTGSIEAFDTTVSELRSRIATVAAQLVGA